MQNKNIPGTDLKCSGICLGTAELGKEIGMEDSLKLLDHFWEKGGNFIDTAHVYADWLPGEKSSSERTIGKWLTTRSLSKGSGREKVVIATKGGHPDLSSMHRPRLSRNEIVKDLNESLELLKVDTIDLYWLHRDDPGRPVGDILETMNEQVQAGNIRYFACSNWSLSRIREAVYYAKQQKLSSFVANQPMWSMAVPNRDAISDPTVVAMDLETRKFHLETQMAVIPYTSQARGFFTKVSQGGLSQLKDWVKSTYYNEENMKRLERATLLAQQLSTSITAISLGYLIGQPFVTIPIVGCQSISQLNESLPAVDLAFTLEMVKYLEGSYESS